MPSRYEKLHHVILLSDFFYSKCDNSFFIYKYQGITLCVFVYVDNILLTITSSKWIHDLIIKLHKKFALKKLGTPKYFLSIEVKYQSNIYLLLTQIKYVKDLISKVNMTETNEFNTHISIIIYSISMKLTQRKIFPYIDQQLELYNMSL